jgi:hypothetical protein
MEADMKDLLDRYLAAVERRLPKHGAKDIIAELREAISSKIEARTAGPGRPANDDDIAEVLKSFGHPNLVAARYTGHDHLIGPQLYPWFWPAQRTAVGLAIAFTIVISAVAALRSELPISRFIDGLGNVLNMALLAFAIVAGVFIALERSKAPARFGAAWNPKSLPQDHIRAPKSRFDSLFTLVFDVIFILWWVRWVRFPNQVPGDGEVDLNFSEAWAPLHGPILALMLLAAAVHVADVFHPAWSRLRSAASILGHLGGLAVMSVLLNASRLVEVTAVPGAEDRIARIEWWIDGPFRACLGFVALVWAIALGVEVWRQIQAGRPAPPAPATMAV